ncbi:MAG TPA: phosphotransferase [Anaerolineales bacterium]|nr:phosphotransferase [Anaerolineales bacterium]HRF47732.1 phosphotransferase [Anaerolineales bacterium]
MLEPPDLDTTALAEELARSYALSVAALDFLALGADPNTAVFRAIDFDRRAYFVKLRGSFDPVSVTLPDLLRKRGSVNVIAPLKTHTGALACDFDRFTLILYPYVDGRDAWETGLTETQWHALGRALKSLHTLTPPPDLAARIRRETYAPLWRDRTRAFLGRVEHETWAERVAVQAAELLRDRRDVIQNLVDRAERLATTLQEQPREAVVCHSDIHAGNVLLDAEGVLHVVDWDDPILAPKERDLMFIGGGLFGGRRAPAEEEALFYAGYGDTLVDAVALAYYRYERIIVDIAVYCESLLDTDAGGVDRAQSLHYLESNFEPGQTIDLAYRADRSGFFSAGVSGDV